MYFKAIPTLLTVFGLAAASAGAAAAQNPPPPGTPPGQVQQLIDGSGLRTQLLERLRTSGMSATQIRQRLAQMGYDSTTLDPYLVETGTPPAPSAGTLTAVQALGLLQVAPAQPSAAPAPAAAAAVPAGPPDEQIFGLSVFQRATTQFQPVTTGPVPGTYVLGPGDELVLILTGDVEATYSLPVTRDGFIVIPQIGQVWVNGISLDRLRDQLYTVLGRGYSGIRRGPGASTRFEITLGRLRTNQVFVTGEVAQPGTFLLSPVASVLNALYLAGGPTAAGSFRNVQIVRGGRTVSSVDLYDYLLEGNNLDSIRLQPGDVIFVPLHGDHVTIRGAVNRPGIYELLPRETLFHLFRYAGGFTTRTHIGRARITQTLAPADRRVGVERVQRDADLAEVMRDSTRAPALRGGDDVTVFAIRDEVRNAVTLEGRVWREGTFEFRPGMRLWDLIRLGDGLMPEAYLEIAHLTRINRGDSTVTIRVVSLDTLPNGTPRENPVLTEFDHVRVYARTSFQFGHVVEVKGAVQRPGEVSRPEGLTLRDAILRSGGLVRDAWTGTAYISRRQADLTRRIISVALRVDSLGVPLNTDTLEDFDIVEIYALERFRTVFPVTISGEVRRPLAEEFHDGLTLRDLIVRAGGLTSEASLSVEIARLLPPAQQVQGRLTEAIHVVLDSTYILPDTLARFYLGDRDSLRGRGADTAGAIRLRPYDQIIVRRVANLDLPRVVMVRGQVRYPGAYVITGRDERVRDVILRSGGLASRAHPDGFRFYRDGQLVNIELPSVLRNARHRDNIALLPGDSMVVPEYNPVVLVRGAVNSPASVLYRPGAGLDYYIANAGGYAVLADRRGTHVRFANGRADVQRRFLFFTVHKPEPGPGSVVTVPALAREDKTDWRGLISDVVQIVTAVSTVLIISNR